MGTVILDDRFLGSAYSLPKEIGRKIFKSLHLFSKNPDHPGLHREKLSGRAEGFFSIRVDDNYRFLSRAG
jgi:plasmid maintenance system killer protein